MHFNEQYVSESLKVVELFWNTVVYCLEKKATNRNYELFSYFATNFSRSNRGSSGSVTTIWQMGMNFRRSLLLVYRILTGIVGRFMDSLPSLLRVNNQLLSIMCGFFQNVLLMGGLQ